METNITIPSWFAAACLSVLISLCGCVSQGETQPLTNTPARLADQTRAAEEYRLGTGDVISVRVYGGEEEVRLERIRLDHSGKVSLPFGQFHATGRTIQEVETAIMQSVQGRLLRNPRVWVNVEEYRPFFVEGQVGRPGAYPYQPGLNVRKAVTIAGGLRERASLKKIFLFRERDGSGLRLNVDLNASVGPGDTVVVEEGFF